MLLREMTGVRGAHDHWDTRISLRKMRRREAMPNVNDHDAQHAAKEYRRREHRLRGESVGRWGRKKGAEREHDQRERQERKRGRTQAIRQWYYPSSSVCADSTFWPTFTRVRKHQCGAVQEGPEPGVKIYETSVHITFSVLSSKGYRQAIPLSCSNYSFKHTSHSLINLM